MTHERSIVSTARQSTVAQSMRVELLRFPMQACDFRASIAPTPLNRSARNFDYLSTYATFTKSPIMVGMGWLGEAPKTVAGYAKVIFLQYMPISPSFLLHNPVAHIALDRGLLARYVKRRSLVQTPKGVASVPKLRRVQNPAPQMRNPTALNVLTILTLTFSIYTKNYVAVSFHVWRFFPALLTFICKHNECANFVSIFSSRCTGFR
jgi:hypothetical protein